MAGDDPFSFLATEEPPKPLEPSKSVRRLNWSAGQKQKIGDQKNKWREKLFSKDRDAKQAQATERELNDFLGSNRPRALPEQPVVPSAVNTALEPTASQRRDLSTPPSPPKQYAALSTQASTPPSPQKRRRRKGLRVTFSERSPEVVGEGGDESEEPTVEISLRKNRAVKNGLGPQREDEYEDLQNRRPTLPELHLDTSFDNGSAPPSAKQEKKPEWKPPLLSPQDHDFLMSLNGGEPGSRLSMRASSDSRSFAQRINARMQAEEGLALQHRLPQEDPSSPTDADDEAQRRQQEMLSTRPSFTSQQSHLSQQSLGVDEAMSTLSLRTSPVPAVHDQIKALRRDDLPEVLSPGGSSAGSLSPRSDEFKPSFSTTETSRSYARPTSPPHQPSSTTTRVTTEPPKTISAASAPRAAKMTLRSVANAMGDNAYQEFTAYVERYSSLYLLAAENVKPLMETSFAEWVRASSWWFLRGRSELESAVRSGRYPETLEARQAVVGLGKAWWISTQIVPMHPEVVRYGRMSMDALSAVLNTTGDQRMAGLINLHQKVLNHLRALTVSMKRNQIVSAIDSNSQLNDHPVDTNIWIRYPFFAPDVAAAFSGSNNRRSMLIDSSSAYTPEMMLLGDTSRYFSYATMFVEATLTGDEDDDTPQYAIQCVLSLKRDRSDWYVLAAISSQSELVNITIQSDRKNGPTWDEVQWHVKTRMMTVKLRRGFELSVAFQEKDFKMIWNIVQYTLKTETSLKPEAGEKTIFSDTLKMFQYMDSGTPKAFPAEASPLCRMALFEKSVTWTEGTGTRKAHRGFRIAVVTSSQTKTLSSVQHTLGYGAPIVFGYLRGENGSPALLLKLKEDSRPRSMVLTFDRIEQRTLMHSLLLGMLADQNEFTSPNLPTRSFSINEASGHVPGTPGTSHLKFNAGSVSIIDLDPAFVDITFRQQILSQNLRTLVSTDWGTVTDRINIGPGEMKIGLDPNSETSFYMYREKQEDLTVAIAENLVDKDLPDRLTQFLEAAKNKPMVRRYEFNSLETLHSFQEAVTGFQVIYDGMATSFAISRRRMVVPIHKKWEASGARLQLVSQNRTMQLVVFFGNDFSHGRCMNFTVRGTDNYESSGRSGKFAVRIVDAKFALPKKDEEEGSGFVCLDMLEYATEHDDITIGFESEQDRSRFLGSLPGSTREPTRMASLRR